MPPSYRIVFYVSGHGFGHMSRVIEVIRAVSALRPDVAMTVKTSAPQHLLDRAFTFRGTGTGRPIDFHPMQCDTGMVQSDSLHLDERGSIRQAEAFHATLAARAAAEAAYLQHSAASLVVGDIPPLAFASANAAGLPSVMMGNFTWDWIYEGYPEQSPGELVRIVREGYRHATTALRLPMSGGFSGLDAITRDIPFVARRSVRDPAEVRRGLNLPESKPLVLMSFGGHGLGGFNARAFDELRDYSVVTDDVDQRIYASGYRYEDLVRAADVVVTKPGYGIISEAIANDTALLYTSRGRFPEYDVLVREMPRYLRSEFIEQEDLLAGRWGPALDRLLAQPKPSTTPAVNGAEIAAVELANFL